MKIKRDIADLLLVCVLVGMTILNVFLFVQLKQSHANERSLSQRIDVLMKEKGHK